jgi:hypothetical protein
VVPLLVYLAWKYWYFGSIIPNSFYVKAASSSVAVPSGIQSVFAFVINHLLLIAAAAWSLCIKCNRSEKRLFAFLFCGIYTLFFVRVDTIMDVYGRFLYPLTALVVYLSIPTMVKLYETFGKLHIVGSVKAIIVALAIIQIVGHNSIRQTLESSMNILRKTDRYEFDNSLMQKEYRASIALSAFDNIANIKIACPDAGVLSYFTRSPFVDVVGLNDRFIAREKNPSRKNDYIFRQLPDLFIWPADKNRLRYRGTLNQSNEKGLFFQDIRWDNYAYIGTIVPDDDTYDLDLFQRKDMPAFETFKRFLRTAVVDGYYEKYPFSIGSVVPENHENPVWHTVTNKR